MFHVNQTKLWTSAIVVGIAAVLLYAQTSSLEVGQPAQHGMVRQPTTLSAPSGRAPALLRHPVG